MNELMVFNNAEFGNVRTIEINGEPWFVGKDVAESLGYTNPTKAMQDHIDKEDLSFNETLKLSRQAGAWLINESGVYALIFGSKLPNARKFKHWVTSEILPTIRKTGTYSITQHKPDSYMIENPADRARRWAEEYEEKLALECKIAEQQPKVEYHDAVLNKSGLMTTTAIAKDLGFKSDYLSRIFKSFTGASLQHFILIKKINYAQKLLNQGKTATEACYLSGFNNYSNFSRSFSNITGKSPGKFQKLHQETGGIRV